jgi:hypothetical protein
MSIARSRSKSSTTHFRRIALLTLFAGSLAATAMMGTTTSLASTSKAPLAPPGNVFTCDWIAEHPNEAARARVSCDGGPFMPAPSPTRAVRTRAYRLFSPLDVGCGHVPNSGKVGQGVFAWTTYKYTNYWDWNAVTFDPTNYTWYIQKPGNITVRYGTIYDGGLYHAYSLPNNNHRWGAQNHTSTPLNWYVCWNVL